MARKLNLQNNYFDKIDTEYKAYLLGFIFADGNIYDGKTINRPNRQLRLSIYCASYDNYIFNKFLEDNKDAHKSFNKRDYRPNEVEMTIIRITNNQICNDLINLGCKINKSKVGMDFPNLKPELIKHFIRGFLDGDGSIIYKEKNNKLRIAFTSTSKSFLDELLKHLPITNYTYTSKTKVNTCYTLWIENKISVLNTIVYLYTDSNYYLTRKFNIAKEYYKTISSQATNTFVEGSETT